MRLDLALLPIGLKTGAGLSNSLGVAIAYLLSTLIHVTFQHGIALNSQRLPNSTFNIQLTNCTKKEKKNNALPCLKYHDLHGKCPFADPTTKIMSIRKWFEHRSNIPLLKKIIWVTGVLRRTVVND